MDIPCRVCGEPIDTFDLDEVFDAKEKKRFLNGEGCDCCKWGKKANYLFNPNEEMSKEEKENLEYEVNDALYVFLNG